MDKRAFAAFGLMMVGTAAKEILFWHDRIAEAIWSFIIKYPEAAKVAIRAVVLLVAFTVLYKLVKVFIKWQNSDCANNPSSKI